MENSQYCLLWNNYRSSLVETIGYLQRDGLLTDVTVVCNSGNKVNAHQLVLAACSTFFRDFLQGISPHSSHPVILLPSDIKFDELESMIEFMYTGRVSIQQDKLASFIKGAKYLKINEFDDCSDQSDVEDGNSDNERTKGSQSYKRKQQFECYQDGDESIPMTTVKGKKVKDHRYTQQIELGPSEDNEKWEVMDIKPVILPSSHSGSRKYRRSSRSRKQPLHLSNNIVCYEKKHDSINKEEPINKVRKNHGHLTDEDDLCTCKSRKIWSVKDTEALLQAWNETLEIVPPSYFIRSVSLCRSVAKRLQHNGVQKNWRQCQVKMKNLRREVKLYKLSNDNKSQSANARKISEVATACEKLLPSIEDIFNKEENIRNEWYKKKEKNPDQDLRANEIMAQVSVLADSDLGDEDTDGAPNENECEETFEGPHHRMHTGPDGTVVHHIVETIPLHTKVEPLSSNEAEI